MSMMHLNGNLLCVVDVETTGLDFRKHEIIQICVLPVDEHLKPHPQIKPFIADIKPEKVVDDEALTVTKSDLASVLLRGLDSFAVADYFSEWFDALNLAQGKRISPLAHNWPFDRDFIRVWLGFETYEHIFDARYRDTQAIALYHNDRAFWRSELTPYPKVNLSYLAQVLKVPRLRHHAVEDCLTTLECYRQLVSTCQLDMS